MSQIGGKMSKFYGKFDIISTDLRIILSRQMFTHFNLQHTSSKRGGWGVKGRLNNVKKTALLAKGGFPKSGQ